MISIVKKSMYKAFGLCISSEMALPELMLLGEQTDRVDVTIEIGNLFNGIDIPPKRYLVKENLVMFEINNTARFCIHKGEKIIVSPMEGADEDKIRLYLLGTCIGALLMQRRIMPLHGSAIAIDGKAYAFVGDSGAGKSTLATAFLHQGYQLLTDDVIAVSFSKEMVPMVWPAYPQQKLWQESLNEFGMETNHYSPLFERETKYAVPVASNFSAQPLPLAGVFELVKMENATVGIERIEKLNKLPTMYSHTFRNVLISRLGLTEWHFASSVGIANKINLYQMRRPTEGFTAYDLVSLILKTLNKVG